MARGRRCSRMLRESSGFEGSNSHTLLYLPEDLVFPILVRLPAKSVARFRCVSTAWLSITTDPFFILAHARRAPKSLLVRSFPLISQNGYLYYHRWTGEYRLLNLYKCIEEPDNCHLDAEVLSLLGASSSWRQIKAKPPLDDIFEFHRRIQVKDCLYWTCQELNDTPTILVFDILKETFSLMELPSYSQNSTFPSFVFGSCLKYGLVDIEGILYLWCVYRGKSCANNVMIDIWAASDDGKKWKNTHSLCLVDEWRWAHNYSFQNFLHADCCFCFREKELMFLFDGWKEGLSMDQLKECGHYLFHWNLKSGKYWTERLPSNFEQLRPLALICKETLITAPFSHTIKTDVLT